MSTYHPCVHWDKGKCKKFSDDKVTSWCVEGPCGDQIPSNADRIRAMSDEELADMLWKTGRNYRAVCADPVVDYNEQQEHLIDWLQQPAEGE